MQCSECGRPTVDRFPVDADADGNEILASMCLVCIESALREQR
jgi:hypothetical protein